MPDLDSRQSQASGPDQERLARTTSSMLWSAWADALGFISEITDERGLRARTQGRDLTETMAWTRRVGGKFGVHVGLPQGCYSDDTQLRLATSRAISNYGFDIEAFAKIELTVWPSYALGGGRASKAAAVGMAKSTTTWFSNFYPNWTQSGGNGAAMRIQPHVYAARDLNKLSFLGDVIRNAVVTHGHPRAIVGAVLHASTLAFALDTGETPKPKDWDALLRKTDDALRLFGEDVELDSYWRPKWEEESRSSFDAAWHTAVAECAQLLTGNESFVARIRASGQAPSGSTNDDYRELAARMDLSIESNRGSGTATVAAATILAAALPDNPYAASLIASRAVGTDTDTIATMAAALIGAACGASAPLEIQDRDYLRNEADRLTRIANDLPAPKFSYPDILRWTAPNSQLEVVGTADGRPAIAGLGWLTFTSETQTMKDAGWSWATTSFGPTVLIKHRLSLHELPAGNTPRTRQRTEERPARTTEKASAPHEAQLSLFEPEYQQAPAKKTRPASAKSVARPDALDLDKLLADVQTQGFENEAIGDAVRRVATEGSLEQMATFVGVLRSQMRSRRR